MAGDEMPITEILTSVALGQWASQALAETAALTGYSKTDVVNRALTVYAHIERHRALGGKLFEQDGNGGPIEQLVIL